MKPIAFISENGTIIPAPNFTKFSSQYVKGRHIYTKEELKLAMAEQARQTAIRRKLADSHYGADAQRITVTESVSEDDALTFGEGERETVPAMTADPRRKRKQGGASRKVVTPNIAPLPETLHTETKAIETDTEGNYETDGLDAAEVRQALFGG